MNIGTVITGLFAIAKAVPIVNSWIEQLVDRWNEAKLKPIRDQSDLVKKKLEVLREGLKNAKTDDERIAFSVLLDDVNRMHND